MNIFWLRAFQLRGFFSLGPADWLRGVEQPNPQRFGLPAALLVECEVRWILRCGGGCPRAAQIYASVVNSVTRSDIVQDQ